MRSEVPIPAGTRTFTFEAEARRGPQIGDVVRFLRVTARVKSTGQQLSEPIIAASTSADGSDFDVESVGPHDLPPAFFAGTVGRFVVFMRSAHPYDDVPVRLGLMNAAATAARCRRHRRVRRSIEPRRPDRDARRRAQHAARSARDRRQPEKRWCHGAATKSPRASFAFDLLPARAGLAFIAPGSDGLFAGQSAEVRVRLSAPAVADTAIAIASTLPADLLAGVPSEVVVAAGRSEATFTVTAAALLSANRSGTLDATLNGATQTAAMHVLAEPTSLRLAVSPAPLSSRQVATLRVDVVPTYPVAMAVDLSSNHAALPVPPRLVVAANEATASMPLTAGTVAAPTAVAITGTLRAVSASQSLTVTPAPTSGWQVLAPDIAASAFTHLPAAVALDAGGQAFVAYVQTIGTRGRISVKREGSGGFVPVGLTRNANDAWSGRDVGLVLDAGGAPVIVYTRDDEFIVAERWNGSDWNLLSGRLNGAGSGRRPRLALAGNTLVFAWIEAGQVALRRYRLDAREWGAAAFVPGPLNPFDIDLAVDASGLAVIAYSDGVLGSTLRALREGPAGTWTTLGAEIGARPFNAPNVVEFGVHVDVAGAVRIAWVEGSGNHYLRVAQFDGAGWSPVPGRAQTLLVQSGFPVRLDVNRSTAIFAFAYALDNGATDSTVSVQQLTATGLAPVGDPASTTHPRVGRLGLAMTQAERPTLAQSQLDSTSTHRLAVRRHVP